MEEVVGHSDAKSTGVPCHFFLQPQQHLKADGVDVCEVLEVQDEITNPGMNPLVAGAPNPLTTPRPAGLVARNGTWATAPGAHETCVLTVDWCWKEAA